jgi:tetratricopeptide (TPR) repeat protein
MKKAAVLFLAFSVAFFSVPPVAPAAVALRKIRLEIVVSPGFRAQPDWRSEFEQRLTYASRIFESEFKIQLVPVKWREWPVKRENEAPRVLLEDLQSRYPLKDADIVIGLTSVKGGSPFAIRDPDTIGQAKILSGYLVLRYPMNRLYRVQEQTVLVHELGHLFGAVHTGDSSSIMFPVIDKQIPTRFDLENHDIIMGTRSIDFQRGVKAMPKVAIQRLLGSYLKMAVQDQPFDFFYMIGVLYLSLGQYDDTLKSWKKAASILPDFPRIHYDLGMIYYQLGDQPNAVKELSRAVQGFQFPSEKPDKANALKALGSVFMSQNNLLAAHNAFSRALALDPKNKDIKRELAVILMRRGQYNEAIRELEALAYQTPNDPKLLTDLGMAYFEAKRYGESERYLNQAIQKSSPRSQESVQAHHYLAKVYHQMKQPAKAIEHFKASCASNPSADCLKGLSQMYFEAGEWDRCIAELAKVLQFEKDDPDVYGTLAVALMYKGEYEKAYPLLREGLRYARDNKTAARFYQNTGQIFIQRKQFDLAEKEFQMGIAKDFSNMDCHFGLAMSYIGSQNPAGAQRALQDVLRLDPKNKKAAELLRQIEQIMKQSTQMQIQIQGGSGNADLAIRSKKS